MAINASDSEQIALSQNQHSMAFDHPARASIIMYVSTTQMGTYQEFKVTFDTLLGQVQPNLCPPLLKTVICHS